MANKTGNRRNSRQQILTPEVIKDIRERVARTGLACSVYTEKPSIITRVTYEKLIKESLELEEIIRDALEDYRRSQPGYFKRLAQDCLENYLRSHNTIKSTTSKTVKTRYKPVKKQGIQTLEIEFVEETETIHQHLLRCPPKILEYVIPAIPQTTIDVLAAQMAEQEILPEAKAVEISAIATKAQETIRGVLSGELKKAEA